MTGVNEIRHPPAKGVSGQQGHGWSRAARWLVAILSGVMEREVQGLPALWPRELGFTGSERSTDYFRRLLSDEAGEITEDAGRRLVSDLGHWSLTGPGLRKAASAAAFAAENNPWQVVCIGSNVPSWAPFLISRNVDFGEWLTPTSQPRFIRSGPLNLRRVVWVTRGSGIYDARFKFFRTEMLFDSWGGYQDGTTTSMAYRIMRP